VRPSVPAAPAAAPRLPAPAPPPTTGPAAEPLASRYVQVTTWSSGFIGAIRITNPSGEPRAWQANVTFPAGVGDLRSHWNDGPRGAGVERTGQTLVFTGRATVAAGRTLTLAFHLDKTVQNRADFHPVACTVNGARCAGVPLD
jgi:hypothetical protein